MRHGLLALAGLALAACASPAAPVSAADPQKTSDGRFLVEVHCAECHAVSRNDRSKHREAPALRTLSESYPISALEESLAEGIVVGHPDMPEFRFRSEDVAAIISYLESIQDR
jgi:cytochrome c